MTDSCRLHEIDRGGYIPPSSHDGYLPPYIGDPRSSEGYSPYRSSMFQFIKRFCTSPRRLQIIKGFIQLRRIYYRAGILTGFQWINGGFSEEYKTDPKDIDIITFFYNPYKHQNELIDKLKILGINYNDQYSVIQNYHCHNFHIDLSIYQGKLLVRSSTFWHSFFSHTRDKLWKGMIEINLPSTIKDVVSDHLALKYASEDL